MTAGDDGILDEAEALLNTEGLRERLAQARDDLRSGRTVPVDHLTARARIEARIRCPMCGEPRSGPPEPWCAGKDNHGEDEP